MGERGKGARNVGDNDRVYLKTRGDEDNMMEVHQGQIVVRVNGNPTRFLRAAIIQVACADVREISALLAGTLMGLLGGLIVSENVWFGGGLLLLGGFVFHLGMQWARRLVIVAGDWDKRIVHKFTFYYRSLHDIQQLLRKYRYI